MPFGELPLLHLCGIPMPQDVLELHEAASAFHQRISTTFNVPFEALAQLACCKTSHTHQPCLPLACDWIHERRPLGPLPTMLPELAWTTSENMRGEIVYLHVLLQCPEITRVEYLTLLIRR